MMDMKRVEGYIDEMVRIAMECDGDPYEESDFIVNQTSLEQYLKQQQKEAEKQAALVNHGWEDERYALQEKALRYEEALDFYANRQAYYQLTDGQSEVMEDYGHRARIALEEAR